MMKRNSNDATHHVHAQVQRRARIYTARNKARVQAAALSSADLSQEALACLALYCPRMFTDPNDALITVIARNAFSNATRKAFRASRHMVTVRATEGRQIPAWVSDVECVNTIRYTAMLLDAVACNNCPEHVRKIVYALANVSAYNDWCKREYGKPMTVTIKRLREFANVTHSQIRDAVRWIQHALEERS